MKTTLTISVLIITAAAAGLFLRLPLLHHRPMHTDEAVHAIKFEKLLEDNSYVYDKFEYHGPTLNYFTLIPACLLSQETIKQVDEFTLRVVPVFFGFCVIVLPLMMIKGLDRFTGIVAVFLAAVSPAMVFYSRYYIQEMLLVCFTLCLIVCGYRFTQSRKKVWIAMAGISAGLMGATKETFIIAIAAIMLSATVTFFSVNKKGFRFKELCSYFRVVDILLFLFSAAVVWVVFFSSFFTNAQGIIDSFATFATYFNRAHANTDHLHPWYYYLKLLLYSKLSTGPLWTEMFVVLMGLAGFIFAFRKRQFVNESKSLLRFIALYTLIMTVAYSIIPYKTPWCLLGFFSGMIILAGYGISSILSVNSSVPLKTILILVFIAAGVHLGFMSYLGNTKYASSPANPYVYAHTTSDIYAVSEKIKQACKASQAGEDTVIQVICPGNDYWPLPWYLRSLNNVGYWNFVDEKMPASPIIVTAAGVYDGQNDAIEKELINHLFAVQPRGQIDLYVPLFDDYMEIRPLVEMRGYVTKELSDEVRGQLDAIKSD